MACGHDPISMDKTSSTGKSLRIMLGRDGYNPGPLTFPDECSIDYCWGSIDLTTRPGLDDLNVDY